LPRDVGVVVVAAGQGRRVGGEPKQFRLLAGRPVVAHALDPFRNHPAVVEVMLVLPAECVAAPPAWLADLGARVRLVEGGAERADSVEAGLRALGPAATVVLVHDGARPFADPDVIDRVIEVARGGRGAIAALPVSDTLKAAGPGAGDSTVVRRTVSRENLWRAQTPQGVPRELLTRALRSARARGVTPTDDSAAVEAEGAEVILVADVARNLKITTAADLFLAQALLEAGR
jgi:2-C-methyl-D-erythritol 4-phosphate cytidylyltransferase